MYEYELRFDSRVVAVSSLDWCRGHTPGLPDRWKTRRRVWGTKYEWQMRVESVMHQMVSGQYYQWYGSPVDERLYRDLTDDIIGDVMSQSYNKKRRSCDLYELVMPVWEILTMISAYILAQYRLDETRRPHDHGTLLCSLFRNLKKNRWSRKHYVVFFAI